VTDVADLPRTPNVSRTDLGAIFVSLELSRATWLVTSLLPGGGEKMSRHPVRGGDVTGPLGRLAELRSRAQVLRTGRQLPLVVIQEAGLDGFWLHRLLEAKGIESHVVDAASVATSRRRRRAKTDRIDGEALLRTLLAFKRGEPRVCAMLRVPTSEEEDRRRLCRELRTLISERVRTPTASAACSSPRAWRTTTRSGRTGASGSRGCARATADRCRRT